MCFRGTIISESWNIQPIFTHPSLSIVSVLWYLRISVAAFDLLDCSKAELIGQA